MKVLRYVLLALTLLAGAFFMVGFFTPDFTYNTLIQVNESKEKSFKVFNDESRMSEWLYGFKSIERISGNPNEPGSRYKLIIEDQGKEFAMTEVMKAFEPDKRLAFLIDNEVMTIDVDIHFRETDTGTEITSSNTVKGKNLFWRSLFPFYKSTFQNKSQEDYLRLKKIIEAGRS